MKKLVTTWNGSKSQVKAWMDSVQKTQAEKERKHKMAAWFSKVKMEEARDIVKNNF